MFTAFLDRRIFRQIPGEGMLAFVFLLLVGGQMPRVLGQDQTVSAFIFEPARPGSQRTGAEAIPRLSRGEEGFSTDRMWGILSKSPTAVRAEMKARDHNGGQSPFAGKTHLKFSCFYPPSRKILIPAKLSETQAALSYAYELKHFEQADEIRDLQAQVSNRAASATRFADRCIELEAQAAYQQVQVARELRKAWVFGAYSWWEPYCWPGEDDHESVGLIVAAIECTGIVLGTGKTARGYYTWLATQRMQETEPMGPALKETVVAAR